MDVFREEAIAHQGHSLHGSVALYQPLPLIVFVALGLVVSISTIAFVSLASIARKETVVGWLSPSAGLSEVYATRSGVVDRVLVSVGQSVAPGQTLGSAIVDIAGQNGSVGGLSQVEARKRLAEINAQLSLTKSRNRAEMYRLSDRENTLKIQIGQAEVQRLRIDEQVRISQQELDRLMPVVSRGFISVSDLTRKKQALLALQGSSDELERQITSLRQSLAEAKRDTFALPASAAIEASQLRSGLSSLRQNLAEMDVQSRNIYKSPVSGVVAYSNARVGQAISSTTPLFTISPRSSILEAVVLVPARSIGLIRKGQLVKLMIDSYPYQHYGTLDARVFEISGTALTPNQMTIPVEMKESFYRVVVRSKNRSRGLFFGSSLPIQSGMTVKADIVVDRRTLLDWMIEPIVAAGQRAAS